MTWKATPGRDSVKAEPASGRPTKPVRLKAVGQSPDPDVEHSGWVQESSAWHRADGQASWSLNVVPGPSGAIRHLHSAAEQQTTLPC